MTDHARLRALDGAVQTPLLDLLRDVPTDARMVYDYPGEYRSQMIPVGRLCREAADEVAALRTERDETRDRLSDQSQRLYAVIAERDTLAALLREARDTIDRRFGPLGSNNIDAPLLARIDAALGVAK